MRREFWIRQCRNHGPQFAVLPRKPEGKHFPKADEYFKTVELQEGDIVINEIELMKHFNNAYYICKDVRDELELETKLMAEVFGNNDPNQMTMAGDL